MTKVLYPGSFDPITKGHMNVIEQASNLFDEIIIAVMKNESKKSPFFTIEERMDLIKEIYKENENIKVVTGCGATVDVALLNDCSAIIRGLRGVTDFDDEIKLAVINKQISNNMVNTICLFPDICYQYVSSSVVREVFALNKDIDQYVDDVVVDAMVKKKTIKRR